MVTPVVGLVGLVVGLMVVGMGGKWGFIGTGGRRGTCCEVVFLGEEGLDFLFAFNIL